MKKPYVKPESRRIAFELVRNLADDPSFDLVSGTGDDVGGDGTEPGAETVPGGL